ncbi:biotin/lipoyl-binding protein [Actinomadura madurae]|nr:biotin/lipoyl-binding protein [Actinomadura madurae]MCQ0006451.1 biotin/lipoyl-binding protein [Actinomadura madurae]
MLAAGALLAGVLSACTGGGGDGGVRLGRVERADVSEVVEAPATVSARATAVLRSPAEGTIARLYVADGDPVDEGDVLAKISSPGAREQLALALEADRSASAGGGVPEGLDLSEFQRRTDRTARDGFAAARKIALRIPDLKERALVLAGITRAEGQFRTAAAAARTAVARLNAGLGSVGATISSITAAQRVQTRAAVRTARRTVDALTIKAPFDGIAGLGGPAGGAPGLGDVLDRLPQGARSQAGGLTGLGNLGGGAATDASAIAARRTRLGRRRRHHGHGRLHARAHRRRGRDGRPPGRQGRGGRGRVRRRRGRHLRGRGDRGRRHAQGVQRRRRHLQGHPRARARDPRGRRDGPAAEAGHERRGEPEGAGRPERPVGAVVRHRHQRARIGRLGGGGRQGPATRGGPGRGGDATVQITRGLREGESIVVRGADSVKQGQELGR